MKTSSRPARKFRVRFTEPSQEFSKGTMASATLWSARASKISGHVSKGHSSIPVALGGLLGKGGPLIPGTYPYWKCNTCCLWHLPPKNPGDVVL